MAAFIACGDDAGPTQPTPVCAFTVSAEQQAFSGDGGTGSVGVSADPACTWSVQGATEWVTLQSPANATGPGTVSFSVAPNPAEASREKTLTIATRPFRITQTGRACTFAIAPEQRAVDDDGASGRVDVTTAPGCAWSATSNASWITISAGAQGQGPGAVEYSVARNDATASRTGTVTIAGRTFTVTQQGESAPGPLDCTYSVSPVSLTPCMPAGTLTATVTTQAGCTWTSTGNASWLSIPSGRSGTGSGTISIRFTDNYDAPRSGIVMVRWPTPTQGQNIQVAQAGCVYAVSQNSFTVAAAGGPGTFNVVQQSQPLECGGPTQDRCVWSAQSNVPWITVTSSMPRTGDNPVNFTVAANTGAARTGRITVRGQVVTITQSAP